MKRAQFSVNAKPAGLSFRTPQSALDRWDPTLVNQKNAAPEEGEISILSEIGPEWMGGVSAGMIKTALASMAKNPVRIVLNSPGGDAFEGIAIYNLLSAHPGKVTVHVLGMAASAASVVAMAADHIEMGEAAMMMIHSAWGLVVGNAKDMTEFADFLNTLDASVAQVYANRSGQKVEDVLAMMEKETWMSAKEAVENGFADVALTKDSKKKKGYAQAALSAFKKSIFALKTTEVPLAALGDQRRFAVRMSGPIPGASGQTVVTLKGKADMSPTIAQQIASFEAKRAASTARMEEIMAKSAEEGRTLTEAETQEYDGLEAEVATVDAHLVRLKKHEANIVARAGRVNLAAAGGGAGATAAAADPAAARQPYGVLTVRANVEPGIPFTRYTRALAMAKGNVMGALAIAQNQKSWKDQTPQVEQVLMAAVAAGDTTTAGWASELVYAQNLVAEFIEFLRPQTIIGRIPRLTPVPFNVRVGSQTSGSSAFWVGQGKPIPVSKLGTGSVSLGIAKAAGLVVLDEELVRSSQPSAELLVRNDLGKAIAQFTDVQFVDPGVVAVANVSPASITNFVNPTAPTGTDAAAFRKDMQTLIAALIGQNFDPSGAVLIMTPVQALAISMFLSTNGVQLYPRLTMAGGELLGIPVVTSMSCQMVGSPVAGEGQMIILAVAPEIMLADDGQVTIDASREAALEMLDNPTNQSTASPTATSMVSMFQTNSVAIKAVRFINWQKRRANIVAYIKDAAYV